MSSIDFFTEPSDLIRILNKRKPNDIVPGEIIIDVDRSHLILGNPYVLKDKNNMEERLLVISKFKDLLETGCMDEEIENIKDLVSKGNRVALRCWCHPLPCHADLIRERILQDQVK